MLQVALETPDQPVVIADDAVFRLRGDKNKRRLHQTATGALMAGCGFVALDDDVLEAESNRLLNRRVELQARQRADARATAEAGPAPGGSSRDAHRRGVDEIADIKVAHLRDHVRQQRIGGDVEGHAQKRSAERW